MNSTPQVIFIVGPTAVGKSEVALQLAKKINAEIISCDSMQVYREVNIVSNKPSPQVLKSVPHHAVNIISVKDEFDVVGFSKIALKAIDDILKRKKIALIVGGSGMYMQVLLDGIFHGPTKNMSLREELESQADQKGNELLYEQLARIDPDSAQKIHPKDRKRIIRALEVCLTEGKPFSVLRKKREGIWGKYNIKLFILNRPRAELYATINQRVEDMFKEGLLDEVKALNGVSLSVTAERLIGIREVRGYLKGDSSLEEAKEAMKLNTRHYAKRQLTWFRKEKRLECIDIEPKDKTNDIVNRILRKIGPAL